MTRNITTKIIMTGMLISGFLSCIKKDPVSRITQVLMVPLSVDAVSVDFRLNASVFATTVGYSTTTGTASYTLPYYTITPGNTVISYHPSGFESPYASATLATEEDVAYSTFLIDSVKRAKVAVVKDDVTDPTPGKVKLRFFHFSANAPAVDVAVVATGTILFPNRTFNDQDGKDQLQSFIEVDPGNYQFAFRLAGTTTAAYTTSTLTLLPNRVYTLAARGAVGGATNKALGAWFYPNKP